MNSLRKKNIRKRETMVASDFPCRNLGTRDEKEAHFSELAQEVESDSRIGDRKAELM